MEKLANNLNKLIQLKTYLKYFLLCALLSTTFYTFSQAPEIENGKPYIIEDITVAGNTNYGASTVISFSGLRKGSSITLPGSRDIGDAIKTLWDSKLFSGVDIYATKVEGDKIYIEIEIIDLPQLEDLKITGVKPSKFKDIIEDNKLQSGVRVTENLVTNTKNYLENEYRKKGFLNAEVSVNTSELTDSIRIRRVNMFIDIDKGEKIKVKEIVFEGNDKLGDKKLRKAMKNTKKRNFVRFFKRSKYIEGDFKEDLVNIVNKYKEIGYRDARILSDSLIINNDNTVSLNIKLAEGDKYTFGKIEFLGNTVFSDQILKQVLRIEEGDTYNGVKLKERIADNTRPDAQDLTNWYQDRGYLFSTITPVETSTEGNVINMEIRIVEGKPAYINNISVTGNEVTNDKVIYRELRLRPGQLYSRADVVRSVREIGQLGFFDAQQIAPELGNVNQVDGTLDIEFSVVEQGSSQIELQGGFGGGGFIGTLGLSFNNFSIKNIFNKKAYKPVPRGDGQSLALRLQASRFFRTFNFSFSEPWLGGKKPVNFSASVNRSTQFLFDPLAGPNGDTNRDSRFNITGVSIGLAKRLKVPDDFFTLSQSLSFQFFDLENFNTALFTFGNGVSNNLAYTIALNRRSTAFDPIYPIQGSDFTLTGRFTLPYSLWNGVDYEALAIERDELEEDLLEDPTDIVATNRIAEIDQERFRFLEFYRITARGLWYTPITQKLILRPSFEFGFLGAYNNDRGIVPFERFFLGGDGLGNGALDGRETVALRGYPNNTLTPQDGSALYNKFSLELRYPIILKAQTKIFLLGFAEAGAAFENFREFNPFDLNRSAGAGVRIFLPQFGLLGIDFGYGFDPLPGQIQPNGFETHFILGQQF